MTKVAASDDLAIQRLFETLALDAGRRVMEIFRAGCSVKEKPDASPVTEADHAAEKIILDGLRGAFPVVPCVAEEEIASGMLPPELGSAFFLVDPLDGTKEFVKQSADFTINIAMIRDGRPAIGVVYAPCSDRLFSGRPGLAETIDLDAAGNMAVRRSISVRLAGDPIAIVASRSHFTAATDRFIQFFGGARVVSVGSSLKFCMIACGEADLYPRLSRTMEWDTAAGDAILRAAGGSTLTMDGTPLTYGKRNQADDADFANPFFVAKGGVDAALPAII